MEYAILAISCADPGVELHCLVHDLLNLLITVLGIVPVEFDGKTYTFDRLSIPKLADDKQVGSLILQVGIDLPVLHSSEVCRQECSLDFFLR